MQRIKDYIYENELIEDILTSLNCHHIKKHNGFYTAGNPDGNNTSAIVVYENENLVTINYTRQLVQQPRGTDLFDLISFIVDCSFPEALKWACNELGIDYYSEPEERPESLQILELLRSMSSGTTQEDDKPLKPIPDKILTYYLPYGNKMWEDDGISLETQEEFMIGFDARSGYITIPIFDNIGSLVGVKGRFFGECDGYHSRFVYLEKCNKSKILYGMWQNRKYIKKSNTLIIVESEKSVLKLAEIGVRNVVATGGKSVSKYQIELITRTGCTPIFAFDKDVELDELNRIADMFMPGISVYAMYDSNNLLNDKMSPTDDLETFNALKQNLTKLR